MKFIYFLSAIILTSCQNLERKTNEYQIISVLVKEFGHADPPVPVPPSIENKSFSKKQLDSVYSQSQHLGMYPIMEKLPSPISKNGIWKNKPYFYLIKKMESLHSKTINISLIDNPLNHKLSKINTIKYHNSRHYISDNFDRLLYFSPIAINKGKTEAVTVIGNIRGYLNSSSFLVYLHKIKTKWIIKDIELLEIS